MSGHLWGLAVSYRLRDSVTVGDEVVSAAWEQRPGHICRVDGNAEIFSCEGLREKHHVQLL